ncbi:MAG TPA: IPT/TIG domain-containing protein, partial [Bacteroidia bacterium]|nr:IPT/TIG domain-containing protein [Bacteroidia bacterium]
MKKFFLFLAFIISIINANAQSPTINSFSPSTGSVGTLVTITGTNLGSPTAFSIGGVTAIVVSDTSIIASNKGDTLVGLVMPSATTGAVSITTLSGTVTSSNNFTVTPTSYPSSQQGSKLVGTGAIGGAGQGYSVSISADGNTAIVGGAADDSGRGAEWVYIRSGGTWTQQGNKLVGTGAVFIPKEYVYQGLSVSISADGNTAIVGGPNDNGYTGAAWVYTRTAGIWKQQGSKLVGTGATGTALQGTSVSISADGNTAIIGGQGDNSAAGAAWVFTRSAGIWTQQGNKLVGTGAIGAARQGYSVSISADGNTAIVGGNMDDNNLGAAWIFTRSGGAWTQQGSKLVGTGYVFIGQFELQGQSVALSADGSTATIGAPYDSGGVGAAWIFTRSAGTWAQQGGKLVGTGAVNTGGGAEQGQSVSLSADGNTAIVGGNDDNPVGAAWVFTRSGGTWTQQGNKLVGTGSVSIGGAGVGQGQSVSISADGNTVIVGGQWDNNTI